jgi:hypothetical protein
VTTTKRPLEVGDRVRVYGHRGFDWKPTAARVVGFIDDDTAGMVVRVQSERYPAAYVHPKQCRRLVKKPRRRCVLVYERGAMRISGYTEGDYAEGERIGYVEERRKK